MFLPPALPDKVAHSMAQAEESMAAVKAFHEACETGKLTLPASRGEVLRGERAELAAGRFYTYGKALNRQMIKFNYPRRTYLSIADYVPVSAKSFVKSCMLVSNSLTTLDASRAMTWNIDKGEANPFWIPDMFLRVWTYDRPDLGFRKRMWIRDDKSILLEVATYAGLSGRKQK
jgi:hypothetical protein